MELLKPPGSPLPKPSKDVISDNAVNTPVRTRRSGWIYDRNQVQAFPETWISYNSFITPTGQWFLEPTGYTYKPHVPLKPASEFYAQWALRHIDPNYVPRQPSQHTSHINDIGSLGHSGIILMPPRRSGPARYVFG